mgnify:CR=1 FL=1
MSDVQIILQFGLFNRPRTDDARLRRPDTWSLSEVNRRTSDKAELASFFASFFVNRLRSQDTDTDEANLTEN